MALKHGPFPCGLARTAGRGLTLALLASAGLLTGATALQQVGDTTFHPTIADPAFGAGQGPRVVIDEAHFNYHTVDGRYQSFARVLRADGFVVEASDQLFSERTLAKRHWRGVGLAAFQILGESFDRSVLIEVDDRQHDVVALLQLRQNLNDKQGMSAQLEEVIVDTDALHTEDLFPHVGQRLLRLRAGGDVFILSLFTDGLR